MLHVVFVDPRLDDGIHRAGLFAEAAVNALEQIDVVARGATCTVGGHVRVDRDRQRRAHRLAQLAGDTALLAVRIGGPRKRTDCGVVSSGYCTVTLRRNSERAVTERPCSSSVSRKVLIGLAIAMMLLLRLPGLPVPGADLQADHDRFDRDPDQRHRDQYLPTEPHDLVIAVAWKGRAQPEEHAQQ